MVPSNLLKSNFSFSRAVFFEKSGMVPKTKESTFSSGRWKSTITCHSFHHKRQFCHHTINYGNARQIQTRNVFVLGIGSQVSPVVFEWE
jgi:hypothetical protein